VVDDRVPRRRTGRPSLGGPTDPISVKMCVTVPSQQYDQLYRAARAARMSVPAFCRARLSRALKPGPDRST